MEQLSLEGEGEASSSLVEKAAKSGNYDEFIIVNLRATITTNQAFLALQGNAANVQNVGQAQMLFEEVNRLYQRALELDPESLEVKAQFAQLKSMMFGDLEGAISLLKDALAIARSRDEVQDLLTVSLLSLRSHYFVHVYLSGLDVGRKRSSSQCHRRDQEVPAIRSLSHA